MITTLYAWAKYRAKVDGLTVAPEEFKATMERVCNAQASDRKLMFVRRTPMLLEKSV